MAPISGADVATQQAALAQAEATLPPLQKVLAQQRNLLATLTGRLPEHMRWPRHFELNDLRLPRTCRSACRHSWSSSGPTCAPPRPTSIRPRRQVGVAVANQLPQINAQSPASALSR